MNGLDNARMDQFSWRWRQASILQTDRPPRQVARQRLGVRFRDGGLSFGGFSATSGLTRFTRIDDAQLLRDIADPDHEWLLGNLTDSVDHLWEYAEEHGVADRMVVVIGSDFGRTNFYNAGAGKDHWPIGSFIVMEKDQPWTGRAVGENDGLHFAQRINPRTLQREDRSRTIIYPKHVHKALRRYLGMEGSAGAQRFPFNNTEDFEFFG